MALTIAEDSLESAAAKALIAGLNEELSALYPEPGANHFSLTADEVGAGTGAFLVAREDGTPVGCGAIRPCGEGMEVKRMYVVPGARGRGISRRILNALEIAARDLGASTLILETGIRQHAAIALYERHGFQRIPPFGEYIASAATSICMRKSLKLGTDDSPAGR